MFYNEIIERDIERAKTFSKILRSTLGAEVGGKLYPLSFILNPEFTKFVQEYEETQGEENLDLSEEEAEKQFKELDEIIPWR